MVGGESFPAFEVVGEVFDDCGVYGGEVEDFVA